MRKLRRKQSVGPWSYLINPNAAQGPDSQSSYEWVWVFAVLDECGDGHDGHVRLTLGVVHQVEVDELLQLQVVGLMSMV